MEVNQIAFYCFCGLGGGMVFGISLRAIGSVLDTFKFLTR